MTELVGFIGSAHMDQSTNFDAQRCVNLFPAISASGTAKSAAKLVGTPGLSQWTDKTSAAQQGVRGMLVFDNDSCFVVMSTKVYRINRAKVAIEIGTVPYAVTPVSMSTNGQTVVFTTGPKMFVINVTLNTMVEFVDPSFTGATSIWFINGSYVFSQPNTSTFWVMDPYSTTLDPLMFAVAEGAPDGLVDLVVNHQEIWLFGVSTIEVWSANGDPLFPYARVDGVFIEQGCAAAHSIARMDDSIFWLSSNTNGEGMVFRTVGYQLKKVSTEPLEQAIAKYAYIADAVAYCYQQVGHHFYVLSFPSEDVTWVYDNNTDAWHQRAWRKTTGKFGRHRGNCHAFFDRKNLVGDWENGKIYVLDSSVYDDDGTPLIRLRAAPHIAAEMTRIPHISVQFDMETGVGVNTGQGSNPVAMLRWSDDGGHTWSNLKTVKIGKMGEYKARARFTRLGQSRDRVYELSIADPIKVTLISANLNVQ
jgi:hypothetical protein